MEVAEAEIADVKMLKPVRHGDMRGFFSEVFKENVLREHGLMFISSKTTIHC
jgi:dTDP-4-dehydrorhamnose 3,5-epimerase